MGSAPGQDCNVTSVIWNFTKELCADTDISLMVLFFVLFRSEHYSENVGSSTGCSLEFI